MNKKSDQSLPIVFNFNLSSVEPPGFDPGPPDFQSGASTKLAWDPKRTL